MPSAPRNVVRLLSASIAGMVLLQQYAPELAHDAPDPMPDVPRAAKAMRGWEAGTALASDAARTTARALNLSCIVSR